jgi:hypothetical protein
LRAVCPCRGNDLFIAAIVGLLVLIFGGIGVSIAVKKKEMAKWPATKGRVLSSTVARGCAT